MSIKFKKKQKLIIMIFLLNINNNFSGTAADYLKNLSFKYKGQVINGIAMAAIFGIGLHLFSELGITESAFEGIEEKFNLTTTDKNGKKTSLFRDNEGNLIFGRSGQKSKTFKDIHEFIKKFYIEEYIEKNFGLENLKNYINSKIDPNFIEAVLKKKEERKLLQLARE